MIVDIHAHFAPRSLPESLFGRAAEFPGVTIERSGDSFAFAFEGGKTTRPMSAGLWDVDGRLAWMDEQGIDLQVVGGWLDMFGYEMPVDQAEAWSAAINDDLVAFCAANERFVPLGTVPLQNGEVAARILRDLRARGLAGVMIGTQSDNAGGLLDTEDLDPFWQAAHETGAFVFIHPMFDSNDSRTVGHGLENALGRVTDTTVAVARLVTKGHPSRFNGARILASCGGGGLAFTLGRLRRNHALHPDDVADPLVEMQHLYYDSILHDPAALDFLADKVGSGRILMGSDKPFPIGDFTPLETVAAMATTRAEKGRINGGLAVELLGL